MLDESVTLSGPPLARSVRLTSFEQATALFGRWEGRFEQLSCGRFTGTLRTVRGRAVRVLAVEVNQQVLLRGHDGAGMLSVYPVTDRGAANTWHGHRLAAGQVVVHGFGAEVDHYSARKCAASGLSLRPGALAGAARALLGAEPAVPHDWDVLSPPPEAFAQLNRRIARLVDRGVADPSVLGTAEGARLEQECVRALVACLYPPAPHPVPPRPERARAVRRAEELMRARLADPLGAIDLCRELGVSDRTLRLAFREQYGMGPMAFFRCLRLNAARTALRADPLLAVGDAARANGFHHLGNFSADYRRLFGERPSDTPRGSGA